MQEAHQQQQDGSVYLDVRSIPEFETGHPGGAYNIPIFISTNGRGRCGRTRSSSRSCAQLFRRRPRSSSAVRPASDRSRRVEILVRLGITRTLANVRRRIRWFARTAIKAGCTAGLPVETSTRPIASTHTEREGVGGRQGVISRAFHTWERRLASAATNRAVRPFEWGLDWLVDDESIARDPGRPVRSRRPRLQSWGEQTVDVSERFYDVTPADDYALVDDVLTFTSAVDTPHAKNNLVAARYFPDRSERGRRRAVVVLPAVERRCRGARRPLPSAQSIRHLGAPSESSLSRRHGCRPSCRAPTTSSARTSDERRRSVVRPCWTRDARLRGCTGRGTSRSAFSGRAWARAWRC